MKTSLFFIFATSTLLMQESTAERRRACDMTIKADIEPPGLPKVTKAIMGFKAIGVHGGQDENEARRRARDLAHRCADATIADPDTSDGVRPTECDERDGEGRFKIQNYELPPKSVGCLAYKEACDHAIANNLFEATILNIIPRSSGFNFHCTKAVPSVFKIGDIANGLQRKKAPGGFFDTVLCNARNDRFCGVVTVTDQPSETPSASPTDQPSETPSASPTVLDASASPTTSPDDITPPPPPPEQNQDPKSASRRRMQSTASKSFQPGDDTYQQYLKTCGHFDYPLFLHVDRNSHLLVYGMPPKHALEAGCPFGAAHSVFTTREGKPVQEKEILMWSNAEDGMNMFQNEESLPIGTFKLADLAQAFEVTQEADNGNSGAVYDLVTNNCATFLVKMANTLGVKIDGHMTSFVARRLFEESGKDLADKIRSSMHYWSFLGGHRNLRASAEKEVANQPTDRALVEALVNKGVTGI